ncbi:hypothetical protein F4604DRAFT_2045896 [Suillus subluteus]|nr:hypothetical protein F4604DRAFT_2045896 [Suillus subluteus]
MSSNDTVLIKAIWTDDSNSIEGHLGSSNTVAMAVGMLQNHLSQHVSRTLRLEPPLDPLAMRGKYFPDVKLSDSLSVCRSSGGLIALFTSNAEAKHRTRTSSQNTQANQISVELNTTSTTDTATTSESSISVAPPRKYALISFSAARKARKRNTTSTANPDSTTSLPQVTMDNQLSQMLASMQNEIREIRGKNETILEENKTILKENENMRDEIRSMCKENENMRNEIESIHNENESICHENEGIHKDLASVRKDLDAARIKHAQDVEALREVTMLLVPLHLRVLLDLARRKVLEHLGHDTWEELRASCSIYQLTDVIFNGLKQKGVSYLPSHESISFLCSYNNVRRAGNIAAHSAKEDDIRRAVLTQSLESRDRKCLEGAHLTVRRPRVTHPPRLRTLRSLGGER